MSQHTIEAEVEVKFRIPDMPADERDVAYPTMAITYNYKAGRRAFTPRGEYAPIDPPEPPEVELVGVKLLNGDGLEPEYERLLEWAENWLDDAGFNRACEFAEDDRHAMRNTR